MSLKIIEYFKEVCKIPHESGNEKQLSDFLIDFAKQRNLFAIQDDMYNVIIKKPATKGYENCKTVIIQGHLDMICEKDEDGTFPSKLIEEGNLLKAYKTTLGADDGVAVAIAMALMDSNDIPHPPLEFVMTTSEETGMFGANALDASPLCGQILINIDSDTFGEFFTSCAGGTRIITNIPIVFEQPRKDYEFYSLELKGLNGGHSGNDIEKERGNSIVLLARSLKQIAEKFNIKLALIQGGEKDNVIPRQAQAVISICKDDVKAVNLLVETLSETYKNEHKKANVSLELIKSEYEGEVFSEASAQNVLNMAVLFPNGVKSMSLEIEGLVEASNNLGLIKTLKSESQVMLECLIRSCVESKKRFIAEQVKLLAKLCNGSTTISSDYPSWEYNENSNIRKLFEQTYEELFNKKAKVVAIHAGLECGLLIEKIGNLDAISIGPTIYDIHTTRETLNVSSFIDLWELVKKVLEKLH